MTSLSTQRHRGRKGCSQTVCLILNIRKINQSFDFATLLMTSWNELQHNSFVMCGLILPSCCNLKWKLTQGMSREFCAIAGFWLPIPTCPTFWNSFVIIIGMSFIPFYAVAVELCPCVSPPLSPFFQHILQMVTKWQRRYGAALVGLWRFTFGKNCLYPLCSTQGAAAEKSRCYFSPSWLAPGHSQASLSLASGL